MTFFKNEIKGTFDTFTMPIIERLRFTFTANGKRQT